MKKELIEYNLEYFNETLTDEQITNSMLDKVELQAKLQEKDKEIERLNNIINKAIKWFDNADRRGLNELLDILKGVDKE